MDERREIIILRVSEKEKELIEKKMKEAGIKNKSGYIRKMAIDGYLIRLDLSFLKEILRLLSICSNNLNQYAKKANATGCIYEADIRELKKELSMILMEVKKVMLSLNQLIT